MGHKPNGESWSDDEREGPFQRRHATDTDDKDQETVFMRCGQPSLGVLRPSLQHQQGLNGEGSFFYIYGNVKNRYGPEINTTRQRVMYEMSNLLRGEQEWEKKLERYDRELSAFRAGSAVTSQRPTEDDLANESTASLPSMATGSGTWRSRHVFDI